MVEIKLIFFFFQAEDGIRDLTVTGVQTCALPIAADPPRDERHDRDVVASWCRLVGGDPRDVEPGQLGGLEQARQFGGDEDRVTHYLLSSCARRIESYTASARSALHL